MSKLIKVACGIMYNKHNKILMGLRPLDKGSGGYWEFPGGKEEPNETIIDCLKREWREELNLEIDVKKHIASYIHNEKYMCMFFVGNIIDEENIKLNVHDEIRFMKKEDISNLKLFEEDYQLLNKLDNI